jgi:hypothetical protein
MKCGRIASVLAMLIMMAACNFPALSQPTPSRTPVTVTPETAVPTQTVSPPTPVSGAPGEPARPEEAILILEPGNGSRVTSPIHVAGLADPTFEQTLVVRVVLIDGAEVVAQPVTIAADLGQRGPFSGEIPFSVSDERQAFIQVFAQSARDGGVTHLASVGVRLAPTGPEDIRPGEPHPEQIAIFKPALGETIQGGIAHVEGFGLGGFEQTLVVEIIDQSGGVVGLMPITVDAPDLGFPGFIIADVPYTLGMAGPGRIVVRDISPAFGGDSHLSSVEVTLEP